MRHLEAGRLISAAAVDARTREAATINVLWRLQKLKKCEYCRCTDPGSRTSLPAGRLLGSASAASRAPAADAHRGRARAPQTQLEVRYLEVELISASGLPVGRDGQV